MKKYNNNIEKLLRKMKKYNNNIIILKNYQRR